MQFLKNNDIGYISFKGCKTAQYLYDSKEFDIFQRYKYLLNITLITLDKPLFLPNNNIRYYK